MLDRSLFGSLQCFFSWVLCSWFIIVYMKEASVIYPHQLFLENSVLAKNRIIYLVEEPLLMGEFPIHRQKMMFHRLSMSAYRETLEEQGYEVIYLEANELEKTEDVFKRIKTDGVQRIHVSDTTDFWLEKRIKKHCRQHGIELERYESQLFFLSKEEAINRFVDSKKHMARFYKKMRIDKNILMNGPEPVGGKWSFDEENRKKLPRGHVPPEDMKMFSDDTNVDEARNWIKNLQDIERYGDADYWLPYTHAAAKQWLDDFIQERFTNFGTYEDALSVEHNRIYHSAISTLLNVGLLDINHVLGKILEQESEIPINSLEGFVRQIIGWREFMRASYEVDGSVMRTHNFFNHTNKLPQSFWTGDTGIDPVDHAIKKALKYGYNHHIDRLMVLGNVMLLSEVHPDEVYKWFMAMYVDAYDWVMVPNVYGMSQFADGGSFATKPYIAGANYVKKMSDYKKGEWEPILTGLYWNFINENRELFMSNHRMSMMPRLWDKMDKEKQVSHIEHAQQFITKL